MAVVVAVVGAMALAAGVMVPALLNTGGPLRTDRAAASDAAATLVNLINSERQSRGLSTLSTAGDLTAVAADRAQIMARA
ncbi:MAG TPA: hypothetical protein VMT27_10100, partial [Actinomycetes bacterium]|nr:hypothetical protein [Actinomycetes bacterium]